MPRKEYRYTGCKNQQICWDCRHSTGGCCWADDLKPVPGWDAVEFRLRTAENYTVSTYSVRDCPQFVRDSDGFGQLRTQPARPVEDEDRAKELMIAIYRCAARDYQQAVKYGDDERRDEVLDFLRRHPKRGFVEMMKTTKVANAVRQGGVFAGTEIDE